MVSIDYEITKEGHTFKDAVVLLDDHGLSEAEIEAIKQQRFNNWYAIITAGDNEQQTS